MADLLSTDALFFFDGKPHELQLFLCLARRLTEAFPGSEARVRKTQIGFYDPGLYAAVSFAPVRKKADRPARFITVTFGLDHPLDDPRALPVPVRPNRWTHHVLLGAPEDVDDALMDWLSASHALARRARRRG